MAIIITTLIVYFAKLPVPTIKSVYGQLSSSFPAFHMPSISMSLVQQMISPAFTIAILAAIESLLSAVVADGMIGDTHSITLTIILIVLMPLAALIPMTTLAAVLLVVAANMADWKSFFTLCKNAPKSDIIVLVATFLLTVFFDLVVAIEIGIVLAALLFMKRMAETSDIKVWKYADEPDVTPGGAQKLRDIPHSIKVFEICGPMFFAVTEQILKITANHHTKVIVLRMRSVPAIDASAMKCLLDLVERARKKISLLYFPMSNEQPMHMMEKGDFVDTVGRENFRANIVEALDYAEELIAKN